MTFALPLVRHGEYAQPAGVPSAHLPHPLTERGREQARAGAAELWSWAADRGVSLDPVLHASPLLRAWETARLIADELARRGLADVGVDCFDALTERCLGSAANLSVREIEAIIAADPRFEPLPPGWKGTSDFRLPLPGAESLNDAGRRVAEHLRRLTAGSSFEPSRPRLKIVVSHGGALRHGAAELGLLRREDLDALSMFHVKPVIYQADGTSWRLVHGRWKQRAVTGDRAADRASDND